jgi:hypothetical protein
VSREDALEMMRESWFKPDTEQLSIWDAVEEAGFDCDDLIDELYAHIDAD